MTLCSCGAEATANGRECPTHFRARLRSVRLDSSVTPTRTKVNYYDKGSLDESLGHDRVDRYWDETDGMGALEKQDDGSFIHTDFKGETKVATDEVISSFVDGAESEDA